MIQIQIAEDRVERVIISSSSSHEEDAALHSWRQIRDLVEKAHARLQGGTCEEVEATKGP